ncbi:hypothetical protein Tco_1020123 [Tanacetum coccineum]|uniref:Uncharacterized protein n=1 Tax=Tanacetum coccineum TaxID=301880 RepID=A0ABQ5G0G7_9ASTR
MEESSKKAEVMEESSSKRARDELEQEYAKKQKMDDDQKTAKMKELIKIIPDEKEEAIDAIPLDTKPPSIMLRSFDREDFGTLWKLVKAKHGFQNLHVFMLVEKRDPLTPAIITDMLNKKLKADHFNEMCYQLLKGRIVRIKRLLDDLKVSAVKVLVTAAKHKLVLLVILMKNMIVKEGKISYYQIIRADGSLKRYSAFIQMLRSFDMEDLETLCKLVKAKHGYTSVEESTGKQKKRYPLTPATITDMLNKKLQADHWNEMWRTVGIKRLLDDLRVTAAQVCVTTAKQRNSRSIEVGSTVEIMSLAAARPAGMWRCWHRWSCVWYASHMGSKSLHR